MQGTAVVDVVDRFLDVLDEGEADLDLVLGAQQYEVQRRQVERIGHGDDEFVVGQLDRHDVAGGRNADGDRLRCVRIGPRAHEIDVGVPENGSQVGVDALVGGEAHLDDGFAQIASFVQARV